MAIEDPIVQLSGVTRRYGSAEHGTEVLRGVDLEIAAGESLAIVGPSGSGKSTLLNIIGGLDRPSSGQVIVGGVDLSERDTDQLARWRSDRVGFIFQRHHLLPQCSALENVLVPTLVNPEARSGANERAKRLLERVGLAARMSHRPGELSGGECQRVAVVRGLINQPTLLLADEPTGALDGVSAAELSSLLVELNREESLTLVVVTHSMNLAGRMDRASELRDGLLVGESRSPLVAETGS